MGICHPRRIPDHKHGLREGLDDLLPVKAEEIALLDADVRRTMNPLETVLCRIRIFLVDVKPDGPFDRRKCLNGGEQQVPQPTGGFND